MIDQEHVDELVEKIFADETNVFAVLDGASIEGLQERLIEFAAVYVCLMQGDLAPDMAEVAPYLVRLDKDSEMTNWLLENGWGNHWGIYLASDSEFRAVRGHLRSFLSVFDESGKPMLFRYYDPRVLRLYLPTCTREELNQVFGPTLAFYLEDDDAGTVVRFEVNNGSLRKRKFVLR